MPETNDAALIAGLRAGDSEAFATLMQLYSARLLRLARRLLQSEEDARDALQDAMVSVYKSISRFESGAMLSTWLHRIVVNACLMRLRARRRRGDVEELLPRFGEDDHQLEPSQPWSESPESILQRDELSALVRASIDELPDNYRLVLHLRDIEELSTEETAAILGISANATKIRLHRARQALRTLLDPHLRAVR